MPTKYGAEEIHHNVEHGKKCSEVYVLATDYASIEARLASLDQKFMILQGSHDLLVKERDELKRRCDKIAKRLSKEQEIPLVLIDSTDIVAIAEGRDK